MRPRRDDGSSEARLRPAGERWRPEFPSCHPGGPLRERTTINRMTANMPIPMAMMNGIVRKSFLGEESCLSAGGTGRSCNVRGEGVLAALLLSASRWTVALTMFLEHFRQ